MTLKPVHLAAVAAALCACRSPDRAPPAAEVPRPDQQVGGNVVPRSHAIPPGHAAEVRKLFESQIVSYPISVVSSAGTNTQFVQPRPMFVGSDHFVVGAPPEIHAALDDLIAAMAKSPAPPPPATYAVTYWAIEADPASELQVAPDLAELAPVLQGLAGLGPCRFRTIDRVGTRALDGFHADVKGRGLAIEQTLSADADALELALELHLRAPDGSTRASFDTKLQLALDKPIVLGQTAADTGSDAGGTVLYVVRARRAE